MRAYGYFQIGLITFAAMTILILAAIMNWLGSIYDSVWGYIMAYYYNWLYFGAIGILGGLIFGVVGAFGTYESCRVKGIDPLSWPSDKEKRKAHEDTMVGIYFFLFVLGITGVLVLLDYFSERNWISTMASTLSIGAILAWPVFIIGILGLIPPVMIDIIYCNLISSLLRRLSNHS